MMCYNELEVSEGLYFKAYNREGDIKNASAKCFGNSDQYPSGTIGR